MEKFTQKNKEKIRTTYKEWFIRNLTDIEIDGIGTEVIDSIKYFYKNFKDFSEQDIFKMLNKDFRLFFSPKRIFGEAAKIHNLDQSKYKKVKELVVAGAFCLGLKKMGQGEWSIMADEAPDIYIGKFSNRELKEKPFDVTGIELMVIPEIEKNKFNKSEIEKEVVDFIRDKKFHKRYGKFTRLIVQLDFSNQNIQLDLIHNFIKKIKPNPFFQIWLLFFTNDPSNFEVVEIYPGLNRTMVNRNQDKDLLF